MSVKTLNIMVPSDILLALNESEEELKKEIRLILAIKYYQKEKLTIGKASQLAGLSLYEFENVLTENNIPISNLTFEDVINDVKKLQSI